MFQAAFLKSLEKMYPYQEVYADLSAYRITDFHNGYELKRIFDISLFEAADEDIKKLSHYRPWENGRALFKFINKVHILFTGENYNLDESSLKKTEFDEAYFAEKKDENVLESLSGDMYFDGYWQKTFFYKPVEHELRKIFMFKDSDYSSCDHIIKEMGRKEAVSVHVRRGDYVGTGFDCLSDDYYERAISWIEERVANPHFYFFSDDLPYVEKKFNTMKNKTLVYGNSGNKSYLDMLLMTHCRHHIIANSSFSFWGAKLGINKNKYVIAPLHFSKDIKSALADNSWVLI